MPRFCNQTALLAAIALLVSQTQIASAIDYSNCEPTEKLGLDNLDRFEYGLNFDITAETGGTCSYEFDITFKHDEDLPMPADPAQACNPAVQPPVLSPQDGLPYYAFRWAYERMPSDIKKATGIDHISIDFNPCGHPPMDVFTVPHYDIHVYLVDPKFRSCMTCDLLFPTPTCDPNNQSTSNGRGFFNVQSQAQLVNGKLQLSNMPPGFDVGINDYIPLMGGHAWDFGKQPSATSPWVKPIWIMGPYDATIVDYEPMFPLSFVSGDTDNFHEENLTYVGQTIQTLPSSYSVAYKADSKLITLTLKGSTDCKNAKSKKGKKSKASKKGKGGRK